MSAAAVQSVAPTDAQFRYIAGLCEERGLVPPAAIYSKADASYCIESILHRQYDPAVFAPDAPTFYGLDADDPDVPF